MQLIPPSWSLPHLSAQVAYIAVQISRSSCDLLHSPSFLLSSLSSSTALQVRTPPPRMPPTPSARALEKAARMLKASEQFRRWARVVGPENALSGEKYKLRALDHLQCRSEEKIAALHTSKAEEHQRDKQWALEQAKNAKSVKKRAQWIRRVKKHKALEKMRRKLASRSVAVEHVANSTCLLSSPTRSDKSSRVEPSPRQ